MVSPVIVAVGKKTNISFNTWENGALVNLYLTIYDSTAVLSLFGGMDHSNRAERNKGTPITDGTRSGAPSVVYRGVQSLKNIMDDAMMTAIFIMNSYNTYGDYKNSSLHVKNKRMN